MRQKSVLITGCSEGGIGDALAKAFHRKGLRVFATARDLAKVEHLKVLGCDVLPLDVVDAASIKQAVESVTSTTGGTLDYLVNNSGTVYSLPLLDSSIEEARKLYDVNVFGVVAVTQAFAPLLKASKGTVINIGSTVGVVPIFWSGYYNASKAAANLLTDQLRLELAPLHIKVILVVTGGVKTRIIQNQPSVTLPENSYYAPAREEIEFATTGRLIGPNLMDADKYAERVVKNALKTNPSVRQNAGYGSTLIWLLDTFIWRNIWETGISQKWNLPKITKKIEQAQKSKQVS